MNTRELKLFPSMSTNPNYDDYRRFWMTSEIVYNGEDSVKEFGPNYLPPTLSMEKDPTGKSYYLYKARAEMPDFFLNTVESSTGVLVAKPPTVELPKAFDGIMENIDTDNASLDDAVAKIYRDLLKCGRVGVGLVVEKDKPYPVFKYFSALELIDWYEDENNNLKYAITCTSYDEITESNTHETKFLYTLYALDENGNYYTRQSSEYTNITGWNILKPVSNLDDGVIYPAIAGKTYNGESLPFVIINTTKLSGKIERSRLQGIVNQALHYYRNSADYEQQLHLSAQDIFCITGISASERDNFLKGSGNFLASTSKDARFEYVGINGNGIGAEKENLDMIQQDIVSKSVSFMSSEGSAQSGEALKIKRSAVTANLATFADTMQSAINRLFKYIADWTGTNENDYSFISNRDFSRGKLNAQEFIQLWGAKLQGLPLTRQDFFNLSKQAGMTESTSFDETVKELDAEILPLASGEIDNYAN